MTGINVGNNYDKHSKNSRENTLFILKFCKLLEIWHSAICSEPSGHH